ncbi:hypothetical protein B0H19DRAFT_1083743 [Mycena capillaripes]|nr:hypothetical protein B0H19DRAFT_1083743 [Mycena capillaripes]
MRQLIFVSDIELTVAVTLNLPYLRGTSMDLQYIALRREKLAAKLRATSINVNVMASQTSLLSQTSGFSVNLAPCSVNPAACNRQYRRFSSVQCLLYHYLSLNFARNTSELPQHCSKLSDIDMLGVVRDDSRVQLELNMRHTTTKILAQPSSSALQSSFTQFGVFGPAAGWILLTNYSDITLIMIINMTFEINIQNGSNSFSVAPGKH